MGSSIYWHFISFRVRLHLSDSTSFKFHISHCVRSSSPLPHPSQPSLPNMTVCIQMPYPIPATSRSWSSLDALSAAPPPASQQAPASQSASPNKRTTSQAPDCRAYRSYCILSTSLPSIMGYKYSNIYTNVLGCSYLIFIQCLKSEKLLNI